MSIINHLGWLLLSFTVCPIFCLIVITSEDLRVTMRDFVLVAIGTSAAVFFVSELAYWAHWMITL